MCVTNTTHRRVPAVSLTQDQVLNAGSLAQRLLAGGFPSTVPTGVQKSSDYPQQRVESCYQPNVEKSRPKRRRKPQKPGKTAKMHDRHFVIHNYHDHANDDDYAVEEEHERRRGGVAVPFPNKLHAVLDQVEADGLSHVISWQPHGRCFVIHNPQEFVEYVMPRYFRQSKLTSFQRQLNLYGFSRLTRGPDAGGYYHELFLRGKVNLCSRMQRTKVKGTMFKAASSPENEPDFYTMAPVRVTPQHSDEEGSYGTDGSYQQPMLYQSQQQMFDPMPLQQYEALPMNMLFEASRPEAEYGRLTDRVFDEAVDELFMDGFSESNISEFVQDWDPTASVEPDIQDDAQLGYLLEKLLE
ncbi:hypothetical protein FisN_35Hh010 [Fistulifera solaris]|uniref:HSF-type DNA-binding domain-containing protein n=1 Tax=Fistulifera solaris TaxID=1519565 RepID=A0A1Z5JRA8_FISSO|nr:hypothetical protein FisN_35Hh010 [Fistulifera solaris]|eukprot:GAX16311.1 hypothetical protein FisN_35Hh010 [Fistulifera solaris]